MAKPDLKVHMVAENQITVIEQGKEVIKRVATEDIIPGSKLFYTLTICNRGKGTAANVVVDNPIPPTTKYVVGSASGEQSTVHYSFDHGVNFNPAKHLHQVPRRSYTNIRWVVEDIPGGSARTLYFQVRIMAPGRLDLLRDWLLSFINKS